MGSTYKSISLVILSLDLIFISSCNGSGSDSEGIDKSNNQSDIDNVETSDANGNQSVEKTHCNRLTINSINTIKKIRKIVTFSSINNVKRASTVAKPTAATPEESTCFNILNTVAMSLLLTANSANNFSSGFISPKKLSSLFCNIFLQNELVAISH